MPRFKASFSRHWLSDASLLTHGRIAAQIACELVCGTEALARGINVEGGKLVHPALLDMAV